MFRTYSVIDSSPERDLPLSTQAVAQFERDVEALLDPSAFEVEDDLIEEVLQFEDPNIHQAKECIDEESSIVEIVPNRPGLECVGPVEPV